MWNKEIYKELEKFKISTKYVVDRTKRLHEDNLKAEFYHKCRLKGVDIILEYTLNRSECDAIILKNNEIIFIVEVKNPKRTKPINPYTKQFIKYRELGVPIIVLSKYENIDKAIEIVSNVPKSSFIIL